MQVNSDKPPAMRESHKPNIRYSLFTSRARINSTL